MVYNRILVALGPFTKVTGPTVSYQYDQKQILVISGVTLPEYYEVDICNEGDTTTVTMVGTADGVLIPNAFLRTGRKVKAYVVLQGQDPGAVETRYEITLPVYVRPAREDIDPTAAEQQQIDALVDALNDGVSRAETAAETAEQAETEIGTYVERAETAAENAETSERNASSSATNAANSASTATTKASQAASSAQSASQDASAANASAGSAAQSAASARESASAAAGSASGAATSAREAAASAGQAAGSASAAAGSASQAAGSAQAAANSASSASQSATNAANKAQEAASKATEAGNAKDAAVTAKNDAVTAKNAAETAQGKAEDAQEAAEEAAEDAASAVADKAPLIVNTVSGEIANFVDGADDMPIKKLVGTIVPVQDLHGYDAPWPAGESKNMADINSPTWASSDITAENGVITSAPPSGQGSTRFIAYTATGLTVGTSYYLSVRILTNSTGDRITIKLTSGGEGSAQTGFGATGYIGFTFEATDTTVGFRIVQSSNGSWSAMELQLEIGTTRTSFLPYENICPISGWTGANVTGAGENLLSNKFYRGVSYNSPKGTTFTLVEDTNVTQVGDTFVKEVSAWGGTCAISAPLKPGTYKVHIAVSGPSVRTTLYLLDENFRVTNNPGNATGDYTWTPTYTLTEKHRYIACFLASSTAGTITFTKPRISIGSVDSGYKSPSTTTLPINWQDEAGTIYDGTVTLNADRSADVVSGKAYAILNDPDLWAESTGTQDFAYQYNFSDRKLYSSSYQGLICSAFPVDATQPAYMRWTGASSYKVGIKNNTTAYTLSEIKAFAEAGKIAICYDLATPQTYHFDSIGELYTYLGTNNVWIDTGVITECDYPADTKLYIDGLTGPDEDMIANANIASGKYFVVNNQLYLSTAAIAAGASIVPGTNCTATNLAEALNAINT